MKKLLNKILPSFIGVDDVKNLKTLDGQTLGAFFKNVVYLNRYTTNTVAYHEAFHAIFNTMLKSSEKDEILVEGKKLLLQYLKDNNTSFEDYLKSVTSNPYYKKATPEQLENLAIEEFLADKFSESVTLKTKDFSFVKKYGNNIVTRMFDRLLDAYRAIIDYLFNDNKAYALFRKIESGAFAKRKVGVNEFQNDFVKPLRLIYDIKVDENKKAEKRYLENQEAQMWISKMYHIYQENAQSFFSADGISKSSNFIENFENFFVTLFNDNVLATRHKNFYGRYKGLTTDKQLTQFQKELFDVVGFNMIRGNGDVFYNSEFLKEVENFHNVINQIDTKNDYTDEELEKIEDGVKSHYEKWDLSPNQIDPLDSLSEFAKGFLYSLYYELSKPEQLRPYETLDASNLGIKNIKLPIITPVDVNSAYYGAIRAISGALTDEEAIVKLYNLVNKNLISYNSKIKGTVVETRNSNKNLVVLLENIISKFMIDEDALKVGELKFKTGVNSQTKMKFRQLMKAITKFEIEMLYVNIKDRKAGNINPKTNEVESATIHINDANRNSSQDIQIKQWTNNLETILLNEKINDDYSKTKQAREYSREINSLLDEFIDLSSKLNATERKDLLSAKSALSSKYSDIIGNVQEILEQAGGINISHDYISYSFFKEIESRFENKIKENKDKAVKESLRNDLKNFKTYFHNQIKRTEGYYLSNGELLFYKFPSNQKSNIVGLMQGVADSTIERSLFNTDDKALRKGFMGIARGNGKFDESIPSSSYRNGNGDNVYQFQDGSFALRFMFDLKGKSDYLSRKIKGLRSQGKSGQALYEKIETLFNRYPELKSKFEAGTIQRYDLLQHGILNMFDLSQIHKFALDKNIFVRNIEALEKELEKDLTNSEKQALEYTLEMRKAFDQMRPYLKIVGIDSVRKTDSNDDAVVFKDMEDRTFFLTILNMALDTDNTLADRTFNYSNLGINEASSTSHAVTLPYLANKLLDENGNLQNDVLNQLAYQTIHSELDRILHYASQLRLGNKGVTKGFDTFSWDDVKNDKKRGVKSVRFSNDLLGFFTHESAKALEDKIIDSFDKTEDGQLTTKQIEEFEVEIFKHAEAGVKNLLDSTINKMLEFGLLVPSKKGYYTNLLKLEHEIDSKKVDLIKATVFENFLKTHNFNQLRHGDNAVTFKSTDSKNSDVPKRLRGAIGATVSCSFRNAEVEMFYEDFEAQHFGYNEKGTFAWETFKHLVMEEPESEVFIFDESKGEFVVKGVDFADAQFYTTERGLQKSLFGLSSITRNQEDVLIALRKGEKISSDKLFGKTGLITTHEAMNVLKLQGFSGDGYEKTALTLLTLENTEGNPKLRALYNVMRNGDIDFVSPPSASKLKTQNIVKFEKILEWDERLRNQGVVNTLNSKDAVFLNADVLNETDKLVAYKDTDNVGKQTENPTNKEVVTDATQMLAIASNEITNVNETTQVGDTFFIDEEGNKIRFANLEYALKQYDTALSKRTNESFDTFKREFIDIINHLDFKDATSNDFKIKLDRVYAILKRSVEDTGGNKQLIEFFSQVTNTFETANPNFPLVKTKVLNMLNSLASKRIFRQKVDGYSLTLVSDFGNVVRRKVTRKISKNNTVYYEFEVVSKKNAHKTKAHSDLSNTMYNYHLNESGKLDNVLSKSKGSLTSMHKALDDAFGNAKHGEVLYFDDRLRHNMPSYTENGEITGFYTEAIVPAHTKEQYDHYEKHGNVLEGTEYIFGTRIPAQDKHSAAAIKIVDHLPAYQGSNIMVAREIIALSGANFENDKVFCQRYSGYSRRGKFFKWGVNGALPLTNQFFKYCISSNSDFKEEYQKEVEALKDSVKIDFATSLIKKANDVLKIATIKTERLNYIDESGNFKVSNKNINELYNDLKANRISVGDSLKEEFFEEYNQYSTEFKKVLEDEFFTKRKDLVNKLYVKYGYVDSKLTNNEEIEIEIAKNFYKKHIGYLNNQLLTAKIALLGSNSVQSKVGVTPASMTTIEDMQKASWDMEGDKMEIFKDEDGKSILENSNVNPTHSMIQQLSAFVSLTTGSNNIGPAVNEMTYSIFKSKMLGKDANNIDENGNVIKTPFGFYLKRLKFLNKNHIRFYDVLSSFISAATDEAKERLNALYGFSIKTIQPVLKSIEYQYDPLIITAALQTPLVKAYTKGEKKQIKDARFFTNLNDRLEDASEDESTYEGLDANQEQLDLSFTPEEEQQTVVQEGNSDLENLSLEQGKLKSFSATLTSKAQKGLLVKESDLENLFSVDSENLELIDAISKFKEKYEIVNSKDLTVDAINNQTDSYADYGKFFGYVTDNAIHNKKLIVSAIAIIGNTSDVFLDPRFQAILFNNKFENNASKVIEKLLHEYRDEASEDLDISQFNVLNYLIKTEAYKNNIDLFKASIGKKALTFYRTMERRAEASRNDITSIKLTKGLASDEDSYEQMAQRVNDSTLGKVIKSKNKKDVTNTPSNMRGYLSNINTFFKIDRIIQKMFVSVNDNFKEKVASITTKSVGNFPYKEEQIKKHYETFLYVLAFNNGVLNENISVSRDKAGNKIVGLFAQYYKKNMNKLSFLSENVDDIRDKIKTDPDFKDSILDKSLIASKTKSSEVKTFSLQYGKNLSDSKKEGLFDFLFGVSLKKYDIIASIIDLYIKKSGLNFENDTFAQTLPPVFLQSYNEAVANVQRWLESPTEENSIKTFGMKESEIEELFATSYFTDVKTFMERMLNVTNRYGDLLSFDYTTRNFTLKDSSKKNFNFPYFMKVNEFNKHENGKIEITKDQRSNPVLVKATYVNYSLPDGSFQKQRISDFKILLGGTDVTSGITIESVEYEPMPLLGYNGGNVNPVTQLTFDSSIGKWIINPTKAIGRVGRPDSVRSYIHGSRQLNNESFKFLSYENKNSRLHAEEILNNM